MKQIIITVLAVVGIVAGAVLLGGGDDSASGAPSNNYYGQESGVITVVEYADFECPACANFLPAVTAVKEEFADQVRFEFRHFPLVQIHPNAQAAHRAAQAAANQGKFWEMHDLLFQRQGQWRSGGVGPSGAIVSNDPQGTFEVYASELGLDMEQFKADASSSEVLATINADLSLGKDDGITGTPSFIIDGQRVESISEIATPEGFIAAVQAALDAKNGANAEPVVEDGEAEAKPEETESSSEE